MLYKKYGSTSIDVSVIGFGGMRFPTPVDIDKNASLVKAGYDAGINYFDTAPVYCDDKSEAIYGAALKEMLKTRRERPFYIATKSSKTTPGEVRQNLERSLKRLGVESIDFYHLWCVITLNSYRKRKENGVLKEFEKMKNEGLIKHICISTHLPGEDVGWVLEDYPFDGVLMGYSAMNFAYRDAGLDAAARLKRAVAVMNPLGGGIIPDHPELFEFLKTDNEETVVEAALRFLINDPRIAVALVGFSNQEHLSQALSAVNGYKPIPEEKICTIRNSLKDSFDKLCTCCRYRNNCPEGIKMPALMDSYNHLTLTGNIKGTLDRIRYHWEIDLEDNKIDKCSNCGSCESACAQSLPICQRLKKIRGVIDKFIAGEKKQ